MASRIIHYAIAVLILQNTKPEAAREYQNAFLAGSLAPDSYSTNRPKRDRSHFFREDPPQYQLEAFRKKYSRILDEPFTAGYYSHLLTDAKWMDQYYFPILNQIKTPEAYYKDFPPLNGVVRDHYHLSHNLTPIPHCPIEEVTLTDVNTQILTFTRDFLDEPAPLHIFHATEIFQFIEETAKEITQLLPHS